MAGMLHEGELAYALIASEGGALQLIDLGVLEVKGPQVSDLPCCYRARRGHMIRRAPGCATWVLVSADAYVYRSMIALDPRG
eukprot:3392733-Pyramimonas_sp.AAC.1